MKQGVVKKGSGSKRIGRATEERDEHSMYDPFAEALQASSCFICYEAMDSVPPRGKHVPVVLPCGHVFGHSCYLTWAANFDRSKRYANYDLNCTPCPSCRRKIPDASVRVVPYVTPKGSTGSSSLKEAERPAAQPSEEDASIGANRAVLRSLRATWRELSAKQHTSWLLYSGLDDSLQLRRVCVRAVPTRYSLVAHLGGDVFLGILYVHRSRPFHIFSYDKGVDHELGAGTEFDCGTVCGAAVLPILASEATSGAGSPSLVVLRTNGTTENYSVEVGKGTVVMRKTWDMMPLVLLGALQGRPDLRSDCTPMSIVHVATSLPELSGACLASFYSLARSASILVVFRPTSSTLLSHVSIQGKHVRLIQAAHLGGDELMVVFGDLQQSVDEVWYSCRMPWKAETACGHQVAPLCTFPANSLRLVFNAGGAAVRVGFHINGGLRLTTPAEFETDILAMPPVAPVANAARQNVLVFSPATTMSETTAVTLSNSSLSQKSTTAAAAAVPNSQRLRKWKKLRAEAPRKGEKKVIVIDVDDDEDDDDDAHESFRDDDDDVEVVGQRSGMMSPLSPAGGNSSRLDNSTPRAVVCGVISPSLEGSREEAPAVLTVVSELTERSDPARPSFPGSTGRRVTDQLTLDIPFASITAAAPGATCIAVVSDEHIRFYAYR